jgi:CheY-like chemotaxis protein
MLPVTGFAMAHVLLVVPDSDLRRSLDFALRADGHTVTWRDGLDGAPVAARFDCTILDDLAVGQNPKQGESFCRTLHPVILLADAPDHELSAVAFRTVLKPLLGPALSAALGDALAAHLTT